MRHTICPQKNWKYCNYEVDIPTVNLKTASNVKKWYL